MVENEEKTEDTKVVENAERPVTNVGVVPMADRAFEAAERVEKATAALKAENDRQEAILGRQRLGGITEGGQTPKVKTQEEIDKEEAEKILAYED